MGRNQTSKDNFAVVAKIRKDFVHFEELKKRLDEAKGNRGAGNIPDVSRDKITKELVKQCTALKQEIHAAQIALRNEVIRIRDEISSHNKEVSELEVRKKIGELSDDDFDKLNKEIFDVIERKSSEVDWLKKVVTAKNSNDIPFAEEGRNKDETSKLQINIFKIVANLLTVLASLFLVVSLFVSLLSIQQAATTIVQLINEVGAKYSWKVPLWLLIVLVAMLNLAICPMSRRKTRGFLLGCPRFLYQLE
jgi:hypothetical protein